MATKRVKKKSENEFVFRKKRNKPVDRAAEIEAALQEYPLFVMCGNPDGYFVVFARNSQSFEPAIHDVVDLGEWKHAYAANENILKDACSAVGLPFMPAEKYPAEMVYGKSSKGVVFCSPIPDDLSLNMWYASILAFHHARGTREPSFAMIAAVSAVISALRFPQKATKAAAEKGLPLKSFITDQFKRVVTRLEIDLSLDQYPY